MSPWELRANSSNVTAGFLKPLLENFVNLFFLRSVVNNVAVWPYCLDDGVFLRKKYEKRSRHRAICIKPWNQVMPDMANITFHNVIQLAIGTYYKLGNFVWALCL